MSSTPTGPLSGLVTSQTRSLILQGFGIRALKRRKMDLTLGGVGHFLDVALSHVSDTLVTPTRQTVENFKLRLPS